jgi:hypothetical protein
MGSLDEMKGVLLSRYVWRTMSTHAKPELAKTWADVRAPSPPDPPSEDCVRWLFASWPIWRVLGTVAEARHIAVKWLDELSALKYGEICAFIGSIPL